MMYVYIMSRADGWHKIGISKEPSVRRVYVKPQHRPVLLVAQFGVENNARIVELLAHRHMIESGFAVWHREWFNADAQSCREAIQMGIKTLSSVGGYDGWTKLRRQRSIEALRATGHQKQTGKRGRPKAVDADIIERAREIWFSPDYATNEEALEHMPPCRNPRTGAPIEWTTERAYREFKASGRPFPKRRR